MSNLLLTVFGPVLNLYHSSSVIPFLVFFALFLLVVRNNKLPHFVRFAAMQSILLDICLMLAGLIISYLPMELQVRRARALRHVTSLLPVLSRVRFVRRCLRCKDAAAAPS